MSPNVPKKVSSNVPKTPDLGTFGDKIDFADEIDFSGVFWVYGIVKWMPLSGLGAREQNLSVSFFINWQNVLKCPQIGFGDIWGHLGTSRSVTRFGDIWGHRRPENVKEGHLSFATHPGSSKTPQ